MKKIIFTILIFLYSFNLAQAEIKTEEIVYHVKDDNILDKSVYVGYLYYDDSIKEKRPGVLVVHEWWGLNDYILGRSKQLATFGYTAFALDMYGDGKTAYHPADAKKFSEPVNEKITTIGLKRFQAALDVIKNHPTVDPNNIAAIGYCFGGSTVLNLARLGVELNGIVSFHGSLASNIPLQPGDIKTKILVCHGEQDSLIRQKDVVHFVQEMERADVEYKFIVYPEAKHSFTNPEADKIAEEFRMPVGYNKAADERSWADMMDFFDSIWVVAEPEAQEGEDK